MRTLKFSFLVLFVMMLTGTVAAQKKAEATIQSTVECDMCKKTVMKALSKVSGLKKASVNIEAKTITVTYNPKKTDMDKIRHAITEAGYDADDKKANIKKYEKLPDCCKKGGGHEHDEHGEK